MRPTFHYAPAANWLSDPNGLVWHDDEWHLFYQYNPRGEDWGHMAWGHAVSRDLSNWEELAPALVEDDRHMIFSGSAVIDHDNTAGFGHGAMVAIYTGAAADIPGHQAQCLAWSNDKGRRWTKYEGNPVLDLGLADFRDPNVFWHQPSKRWIMIVVLSDRNCAVLYGSPDLKVWQELSRIGKSDAPGHLWECPLLIELPIDGSDDTRWLFKVDVLSGAPGSGALYQTGSFDGARFVADGEGWGVVDAGSDFYAAIAWHGPRDDKERPAWIGWMGNHAYQGKLPLQGWRGAMSMPRRMSLRRTANGLRLAQIADQRATSAVPEVRPGAPVLQLGIRMQLPVDGCWSVSLGDCDGRRIAIDQRGTTLRIERGDPLTPELACTYVVKLETTSVLTMWFDCGSLELLSADGLTALTLQHRFAGSEVSASWMLPAK